MTTDDDVRVLHTAYRLVDEVRVPLDGLVATRPSLEDIYLVWSAMTCRLGGDAEPTDRRLGSHPMSSDVALVGTQIRYEQKSYWRNPTAAFFTFAFPLVFFFILVGVAGGGHDAESSAPA